MNNDKNKIKLKGNLNGYLRWPLILTIFLLVVDILLYAIDIKCGIIMSIFTLIYLGVSLSIYAFMRPGIYKDLVNFATEYGMIQKEILFDLPIPYSVLDNQGKILWSNKKFNELFKGAVRTKLAGHNISTIFGEITRNDIAGIQEPVEMQLRYTNCNYKAEISKMEVAQAFDNTSIIESGENDYLLAICLFDMTEVNALKKSYQDEKMVAGLIYIDNYDEALESVEDVRKSLLIALIDRKINKYIGSVNGIIKKVEKDKYFVAFKQRYLPSLQSNKFSILDEVKNVNIGNDMPVSISMGFGVGGSTYIQNCDYSRTAIDLALGRGGDQAIVKDEEKVYYYGGKSKTVEKNTRVKARIKAHALRELLDTKDKVIIMGHSLADVDALGAGVGLYRAIKSFGKTSYIVLDTVTSSLRPLYEKFSASAGYEEKLFISSEGALNLIDDSTLVIVVDVNRPSYTECPKLLEKSKATVVFDHHRQSAEVIANPILAYIEPYASSTCEMVAEILQYITDTPIRLKQQEADALYAGIVIDTNNFANKTGVRTFEAAAYLRKSGADVVRVKKMFRDTETEYKAKADAISNAEIIENAFAITECTSEGLESPTIIGAQAANELLNIRNIKASFVITDYNNKKYISARSIDEVNVQLIMEKLGGGGHLNVAGAQIENESIEEVKTLLKSTIRGMIEDGDI